MDWDVRVYALKSKVWFRLRGVHELCKSRHMSG